MGDWRPSGPNLPQAEVVEKLQQVCRELFTLLARDPDQQDQAA